MKKTIMYVVLALTLSSCGESNPLLGKWKTEAILGASSTLEFKRDAVITTSTAFGVDESREEKVSDYRIEKEGNGQEKVGVSVKKGNETETVWYKVLNKDTLQFDAGLVSMTYHRIGNQ
ncbi:hypothetical protein [Ferrovum myxofaciens]|uniref:Uncharacterized protein n=1 Tax=Ferrovum myxofaciens TaxID=416213 RepID=A0A9E6MW77_9PROT|nr:hypothetical protein [Ferrovum myxofaciens]MBU6995731.1 hypothetical protein [Ferrovum myxofaciens]QKE42093.1 MAG: hypothetical protein HO274_12865 [Ferrovum myxofaciens]QWY74754.1 MAG: hypothetical protein JVY19_13315 [Ferrovum myxofaciens]QWY77500.1 MAG: hypothetical protein JZL65_13750 [Ferrovum myxofaciens]